MYDLADFIARHALVILLVLACMGLLVTAAFWHVVHTYGPKLWSLAIAGWNSWRTTALAHRLKHIALVGPMFVRTMTVLRYLGLHAVIGFVVAAVAVSAFFELAEEIGIDETLAQFDVALAGALSRHVTDEVLRAFSIITILGDRDVLIVIATVVTVGLLLWRRWLLAGAWVVATAGGGLMNMLLKSIFERPRPIHEHGIITETGFSFPSGHAAGSMLIYGMLGYLIVRYTPRAWHIPVTVTMVALIAFVGSSRVILQVHYLSDVLAGYASAAAWLALCIAGMEAVGERVNRGSRIADREEAS